MMTSFERFASAVLAGLVVVVAVSAVLGYLFLLSALLTRTESVALKLVGTLFGVIWPVITGIIYFGDPFNS